MKNSLEYQVIATANGQTGYVSLGQGRPMVMLVGYSGNLLHWNSELILKLAEEFTLYLPDNRRVGLSQSTNRLSMEGLADDVIDFIQALGLERPYLLGWSMGGIIAQAVAYSQQNLLRGLALIASQPDHSYTQSELHRMVTLLRENPGRENRERLSRLFFSELPTLEFRKYLARTILHIPGYVYPYTAAAQELQDLAVANWKADLKKLSGLTIPLITFCVKNDQVVDPSGSYYLHRHVPSSKLISYPDGGHFFLHRYPIQLACDLSAFFAANVK